MTTQPTIHLLLADDQELVRLGVKALLAGTEIEVVAEAATGLAAGTLALEKAVDVVLLDVRLPDGDGLSVLNRIKLDKPELPVLMFSAFDNPASIAKAIALGASGFLLKDCDRQDFLQAIRSAAAGKNVWRSEKLRNVKEALRTPRLASNLEVFLNEREAEVLRHMAAALTNEQIAVAMNIGCESVKLHVRSMLKKLGLSDRTQAAVWAVRNNLV